MDFKNELLVFNSQLALKGVKLRIEQRGQSLNLRGPLPEKSGSEKTKYQRISLNINADQEGLQKASKVVELISFQLERGQFNWKHWSRKNNQEKQQTASNASNDFLKSFKHEFFNDPKRDIDHSGINTTWNSSYLPYLRRLFKFSECQSKEPNSDLFNQVLESYEKNSRSRQQCGIALSALAKHLQIELQDEWKTKARGYGLHKAHFRKLPSDDEIKKIWEQIPNQQWKLVYGLMATYGLRNHEVFFCDLSGLSKNGDYVIRVLPNTKTGEHQSWPFHPEWVELFELRKIQENIHSLPEINKNLNITTLQNIGRRVTQQFRRYKLPINPYDLRHAWAIRTIHIGLPDSVSARMMGHSTNIHTRNYHHWITLRDQQKAVDDALAKQ